MEKELKFEMNLTAGDLWKFSMHHANSGKKGMVNLIFTVTALFLLAARWTTLSMGQRLLLVVCALLFTVWQPVLLYWKARRQAKLPAMAQTICLTFNREQVTVRQGEQELSFEWDKIARLDRLRDMTVLYMDRIHAYLIPGRVQGDQAEALDQMAQQCLPGERYRRRPW